MFGDDAHTAKFRKLCKVLVAVVGILLAVSFVSLDAKVLNFLPPFHRETDVSIAGPSTWGAVDGSRRVLPDYRQVGPPKPDKSVGIFYFLTDNRPGHPILDNRTILRRDPDAVIGPIGTVHWWSEPLFGYYINSDRFVLREHAAMLGDAGINTIIFDNTNGPTYFNVQKTLFRTWLRMKQLGNPVPDFACFAGSGAWNTDFSKIYKTGLAKKLWFYWDGKPLMLYKAGSGSIPLKLRKFFTLRYCWAWTGGKNSWGWDNCSATNSWEYGWHSSPKKPEEMPVAAGGWASINIGRSFHDQIEPPPARQNPGLGINFAEQWRHAIQVNPKFIFVTGWNEWTASCEPAPGPEVFAGHAVSVGHPTFIDEYDPEYSRDIEPMRADKGGLFGGFGDNYYYEMVAYIRKYKGVPPLPFVRAASLHIDGSFGQWNSIGPLFINNIGLAVHRDSPGWGREYYANDTGRNDIVGAKVCYDARNIYFWVQTRKTITSWKSPNWMLLFINSTGNPFKGWLGYNYVIDRKVLNDHTTTLEKNIGGRYHWKTTGQVQYRLQGNQMEVVVPRKLLGLAEKLPAEIHFKWADNIQQTGKWSDFYLNGDCAPPFRFYYRAKFRR